MSADDERTLRFGAQQGLLGLLNHRDGDAPVACILLNVGVTHRVGPRRLNVKLARALGSRGVTSLRFDLAGLGDSEAPAPGAAHTDQFAADLQAAMDGVEQAIGVNRFVLLGICSGAVNAYRVAQRDPRVVGLMMYDGYAHPTWRTRVVHDWRRANTLSVGGIVQRAWRRVARKLGAGERAPVSIFYASRDTAAPDRLAFANAMDALVQRGTQVYLAYSGSALSQYNHASQFKSAYAGHSCIDAVTCDYLPHIDHIATAQAAQRDWIERVVSWSVGVVATQATRSKHMPR